MRPLTPEETASIRKELRWWKVPMIASAAFGLAVLLSMAARGPIRGGGGSAIPMLATLAIFNGALYSGVLRPLPPPSEKPAALRRRPLLPWQIARGGGGAGGLLVLLPMAISGARKGDWGD